MHFVFEYLLGKRRPVVRRAGFLADHGDGAGESEFSEAFGGPQCGQSAADDGNAFEGHDWSPSSDWSI
jgi:hypothetical protein